MMRSKGLQLAAALFGCSLVFCFAATGCSQELSQEITPSAKVQPYDTSGGVAATVNGVEIGENAITAFIEETREANELQDEDAWGTWLVENGYTIDGLRQEVVNYYISEELVRQAAEQNGVTVTDEEIDSYIEQQDEMDVNSEEDRYYAKQQLLQDKLTEVVASAEPTDEELLSYINSYADELDVDAPEDGFESLDDVPSDIVESVRESMSGETLRQRHYVVWMLEFKSNSDIEMELLPDGMPYDIDLTPYEEAYYDAIAESEETAESDSDDGETDADEE